MIDTMKRGILFLLCAVFLCAAWLPANAAHVSAVEAIETLETLGLVRGTGNGFEPDRSATRAEALVMLLRLLGWEQAAEKASLSSPFTDGGWAEKYVAYAYEEGLVRGMTSTTFGSDNPVSSRDYVTMALRALGYQDGEDFTWTDSLEFSDAIGLTNGEYTPEGEFLREDMALVSYTALTLFQRDNGKRLIDRLYDEGIVDAEALKSTRLVGTVSLGRKELRPEEIYETCSSAVLYTELFETEEDLQAGKAKNNGSAFMLRSDGVAVMTYHQLEAGRYARVTTTDGRVFDVTGVLYYDTQRDVAVVRISKEDTSGQSVRFFPALEAGDSDALGNGETVYTVSSPLGLVDSISSGLVSNRSRNVDDPNYLCIQITAPISSGSSGGPLLNRYGQVVGVIYATYTRGQNLNLATPIRSIAGVELDWDGIPLKEVYQIEEQKKADAVIWLSAEELWLWEDQSYPVIVATDCPGQPSVQYTIADTDIVRCSWGDYQTRQSVLLNVTGKNTGETTVKITFADGYGNQDAEVTLRVIVQGVEPSESEEIPDEPDVDQQENGEQE